MAPSSRTASMRRILNGAGIISRFYSHGAGGRSSRRMVHPTWVSSLSSSSSSLSRDRQQTQSFFSCRRNNNNNNINPSTTAVRMMSSSGSATSSSMYHIWNPTEEHAALRSSLRTFVEREVSFFSLLRVLHPPYFMLFCRWSRSLFTVVRSIPSPPYLVFNRLFCLGIHSG
jgi:hypothetical protein